MFLLFSLCTMYKDTQRLPAMRALRSFMSQISNETLNVSFYYVFPYYTFGQALLNPAADPAAPRPSL